MRGGRSARAVRTGEELTANPTRIVANLRECQIVDGQGDESSHSIIGASYAVWKALEFALAAKGTEGHGCRIEIRGIQTSAIGATRCCFFPFPVPSRRR